MLNAAPLTMTDAEREHQIDTAYLDMCGAKTSDERREARLLMEELIRGRSTAQVEKMERQKGLM